MKPHKHAKIIKAWADGAEIEIRHNEHWDWVHTRKPDWSEAYEYRIKPEPKPDVVKYGLLISHENTTPFTKDYQKHDNIKITFDGETGELKLAEVLK